MQDKAIKPDYYDVLQCVNCQGTLLRVREPMLVCVSCFIGFPVLDNGVDFKSSSQVMLKQAVQKLSSSRKKSGAQRATFKRIIGPNAVEEVVLNCSECVVLGRCRDEDETFVGQAVEGLVRLTASHERLLASRILEKKEVNKQNPVNDFKRIADWLWPDALVSRIHAMICFDDNGVVILDLGSTNGTFVNGKEVEEHFFVDGDLLSLGGLSYRLNLE